MQDNSPVETSDFRSLHHQQSAFVIPNPWDTGTARILAKMGFKALATTSAGMAFGLGVPEGCTSKPQVLEHCRLIAQATSLPVTADLENGYGDSPESVADCIREAAATGLAGCSIEDYTGDPDNPIYDFGLSLERINAAVEVCRSLPNDFVFTARAEGLCYGGPDLDDVLRRLQAFSDAGADVLYAPGITDLATIQMVCANLDKPFNVVMGMAGATHSVEQLSAAGVKRISVGSALARMAFGAFVEAAQETRDQGSFAWSDRAIGFDYLNALLK